MELMLTAFLISTVYILLVTVQYGLVAQKEWSSVPLEIIIATLGALNVLSIVHSWQGRVGFVIGSTLGCYLGVLWLRRRDG